MAWTWNFTWDPPGSLVNMQDDHPTEAPSLLESTIRRPSKNTAHSWQRKMACDSSAPKKRFFHGDCEGVWWVLRDFPTFGEGKFIMRFSLSRYIWHHLIGISKPLTPCTAVAGSSLHRPEVAGLLAEHHGICQAKCFKLLYPKGFLHSANSIYTKFSQTCKVKNCSLISQRIFNEAYRSPWIWSRPQWNYRRCPAHVVAGPEATATIESSQNICWYV